MSNPKLLQLTYDDAKLRATLVSISKMPEAYRRAIARSMNRALNGVRTDIVADLRARTVLKAGVIRKGIEVNQVYWFSHSQGRGYVRVSTGRLPLTDYNLKPMRQTAKAGKKPSQYTPLRYVLQPGGKTFDDSPSQNGRSKLFMLRGQKSGKLKVFARLGDKRTPIVSETGPSLQFFYGREEYSDAIIVKADIRFRKELAHHISYELKGGAK